MAAGGAGMWIAPLSAIEAGEMRLHDEFGFSMSANTKRSSWKLIQS